jgi:hypothetical protein
MDINAANEFWMLNRVTDGSSVYLCYLKMFFAQPIIYIIPIYYIYNFLILCSHSSLSQPVSFLLLNVLVLGLGFVEGGCCLSFDFVCVCVCVSTRHLFCLIYYYYFTLFRLFIFHTCLSFSSVLMKAIQFMIFQDKVSISRI